MAGFQAKGLGLPERKRETTMKVTLNTDGSVTFDVATAAEATALARELQSGAATNGHAVQAVVEQAACVQEEAVFIEAATDDDDEDVDVAASVVAHESAVVEKRPSDLEIKRAAARAANLSIQHYVVWEYLVDKDSQRGGVSIDQVMKKFHITRSAANQRLLILEKKGFAARVATGHYRAATP